MESSILVVDRSGNVGEVLRAAFKRRGFRVYEASRADTGLQLARRIRPDVIVLDVEEHPSDVESLGDQLCQSGGSTAVILLGAIRRTSPCYGECLSKPYHYSVLVSRIEQMLEARAGASRRAA